MLVKRSSSQKHIGTNLNRIKIGNMKTGFCLFVYLHHLFSNYSFFSLADKLEQQTDVRKSGMQGFYTNLLTKNISMGGDVDANALSAYTAGSVRQTVVSGQQNTSTTALVIENIGIKPESTKVVPLDKNHIAVDKHAISNTAKLGVIDPAVAKPIIDEPTLPVIVSKPVSVPLPTKKDEEQLMSAKERYLARKRKAEEGI